MNDDFIYEKIPHTREKNAGIRIAKGVKNIKIGTANFNGVDNAMVFEGDAEEVNIGSINIKDGESPFFMQDMKNSSITNVTLNNSSELNKERSRFNKSLSIERDISKKAILMGNYAMFLKTHLIFEEALELLKTALDIFKRQGEEENISISYANIGVIFKSLGFYDNAMKCYKLALAIDKKERRVQGIIMNHINIGIIYDLQAESIKAIKEYEMCIPLAIGENKRSLGNIYANLAMAYSNIDSKRSIDFHRKSIDFNIKKKNYYDLAFAYRNLGCLYKNLGKVELSTSYIVKSFEIFHEIGNSREESRTKSLLNTAI